MNEISKTARSEDRRERRTREALAIRRALIYMLRNDGVTVHAIRRDMRKIFGLEVDSNMVRSVCELIRSCDVSVGVGGWKRAVMPDE